MNLKIVACLGTFVCLFMTNYSYGQWKEASFDFTIQDGSPCYCTLSVISFTVKNSSGCDRSDGSIIVSVTGGSGAYTYNWTDAFGKSVSTGKDASALRSGYYFLTITDKNRSSCRGQSSFEVKSDVKLTTAVTHNANCAKPNGAITVTASGGSGSFLYEWTYPDGAHVKQRNIADLKAGQYMLVASDAKGGCATTTSVTIQNRSTLSVNVLSKTDNTSCKTPNGAVDMSVKGGSSNYNFYWYDLNVGAYAAFTEDLKDSHGGQFSLYVVDDVSGCVSYQSVIIDEKTIAPTFSLTTHANTACSAPFSGSIELSPIGAGPFAVSWTNGATVVANQQSAANLPPGRYGFTVVDNTTGCSTQVAQTDKGAAIIGDESLPAIGVSKSVVTNSSDCQKPNGAIELSVDTDASTSLFAWTGSNNFTSTNLSVSSLSAGIYNLKIAVPCIENHPPVIQEKHMQLVSERHVSLNLLDIISDPDDNLDVQTIVVVGAPESGASYSLSDNYVLSVNYLNNPFSGLDHLRLKACDLLQACTEQLLTIDVLGQVTVYNAVAPNSPGDNKYMRIANLPDKQNQVTIFNRWGDKVFEVRDYNNGEKGKRFEGLSSSGSQLSSGTYFYKIEIAGQAELSGYLALKQ